jgi:hypothetical protein
MTFTLTITSDSYVRNYEKLLALIFMMTERPKKKKYGMYKGDE